MLNVSQRKRVICCNCLLIIFCFSAVFISTMEMNEKKKKHCRLALFNCVYVTVFDIDRVSSCALDKP